MVDVIKVASYIAQRFEIENHVRIDEMKLHKLLYFTQREAIIATGEPMFSERFVAMKYGPVMYVVRQPYKENALNSQMDPEWLDKYKVVLDVVFKNYSKQKSISLSYLSHGESSWRKAISDKSSNLLKLEDIRKDAERMKLRRYYFDHIVPQLTEK